MSTGDTYTYDFTFRPGSIVLGIANPASYFVPTINGFGPGDSVLLEMFENSATDPAPICSHMWNGTSGCQAPYAWYDLQGAVRVSVLNGSIELDHIWVEHDEPQPFKRYIGTSRSCARTKANHFCCPRKRADHRQQANHQALPCTAEVLVTVLRQYGFSKGIPVKPVAS